MPFYDSSTLLAFPIVYEESPIGIIKPLPTNLSRYVGSTDDANTLLDIVSQFQEWGGLTTILCITGDTRRTQAYMHLRSMSAAFKPIMDRFHDTPLGAPRANMETLYAQLLAFLQDNPRFHLTLSQCKVVVRHGDHSDLIVDEEVHRILMEEFELHYPGDEEDYLGGPICMYENFRE